jgi:fumarate hydratase class II
MTTENPSFQKQYRLSSVHQRLAIRTMAVQSLQIASNISTLALGPEAGCALTTEGKQDDDGT